MFDRVKPIEQGEVIPNERLGAVLEFIKANQNKRSYTRSTRCPGKRHLGLIPLASQQRAIAKQKKASAPRHDILT